MNGDARHLEWRNFRSLIEDGVPAVQPVSGQPPVHVFVDESGDRIGLRVLIEPGTIIPASPLADVSIGRVVVAGSTTLEVSTRAAHLFVEFYGLLEDLADRIQVDGLSPLLAFDETIANWKALLRATDRLSEEQQLGLAGELWTLIRIMSAHGPEAFGAWTGPLGEPHDFRMGDLELEVKSTRGHRRVHIISSIDQLMPSSGRTLFLLSLQLQAAGHGAGWTLPDLVAAARSLLAGQPPLAKRLEESLVIAWRYSDEHAGSYDQRLEFRALPVLIEVNSGFPRVTRSMIDAYVGDESRRISDLHYRLDVEGYGVADGSPGFLAILPAGGST